MNTLSDEYFMQQALRQARNAAAQGEKLYKRIEVVSSQDMKGSNYFGAEYDSVRNLTELNW